MRHPHTTKELNGCYGDKTSIKDAILQKELGSLYEFATCSHPGRGREVEWGEGQGRGQVMTVDHTKPLTALILVYFSLFLMSR